MKKEYLYNWIFAFNPHTGNWRACTRDQYLDFFNKPEGEFISSSKIEAIEQIIIRAEGDFDKAKELISKMND